VGSTVELHVQREAERFPGRDKVRGIELTGQSALGLSHTLNDWLGVVERYTLHAAKGYKERQPNACRDQ